ncbi:hypothetical protein SAMN05443247_10429 [Bradyrhizobium erythrophlei]|nr:hypothetical protein SAMN05443247_10429 [Bradyrhizobium erythrophlei]
MDGHSPARRADGPAGKAPTIHVGEENRSPSLFPHGRTRMIVFPLIRLVWLKAATA